MRLMVTLLGFLVACSDKETEDTAIAEEVAEDSAAEEIEDSGESEESQEEESDE
jgi:hypothetical protein